MKRADEIINTCILTGAATRDEASEMLGPKGLPAVSF